MFSTSLRERRLSSKARRGPSIHSSFTMLKLSLSRLPLADIEFRQSDDRSERPVQRSKRLFATAELTLNGWRKDNRSGRGRTS